MGPNKPVESPRRRPPAQPPLRPVPQDGSTGSNPAELHAGLADEARFFRQCGLAKPVVEEAALAAWRNGTTVERELIANRRLLPSIYYRWLAEILDLPYLERIDPGQVILGPDMDALLVRGRAVRLAVHDRIHVVSVPEARHIPYYRKVLESRPELGRSLYLAEPATIRRAIWEASQETRVGAVTRRLSETNGAASARLVVTGRQGYVMAMLQAAGMCCLALWPLTALFSIHLFLSLFFFSATLLRFAAAAFGARPPRPVLPETMPMNLPVYTILVALRDEAAMAGQIVRALDRLKWPKTLLDVKFVCEADDRATIEALEAAGPGPYCEIVRVPRHEPMTKPKALQYALSGARGSLVAVYDAEDLPHPLQLLEAWSIFEASGNDLACVQAPLAIANFRHGWIPSLFAIEYSGLFRALVPFLDRFGLPIPLGGTSNHFQRQALEDVGGWDPYNVTEDADLGLRLYRAGYRTRAAHYITVETAPEEIEIWIRQRSRWLKGWLQTWLVVMRHPLTVARQVGPAGFATLQILIAGMLGSALLHPAMWIFVTAWLLPLAIGITEFPSEWLAPGARRV